MEKMQYGITTKSLVRIEKPEKVLKKTEVSEIHYHLPTLDTLPTSVSAPSFPVTYWKARQEVSKQHPSYIL